MTTSVEAVRDFVLQIEKSLSARRLYAPASTPHREANERAFEKCRAAAGSEGFTVRIGPADIFLDKQSVLNRPKTEESFFFPLYRDGMRALTFGPEMTLEEMSTLLGILELKEHQLGPAEDMVNHLWRCDLKSIRHQAVDGIGDVEDDGSATDDFRTWITDLAEKLKHPTVPQPSQADEKQSVPDLRPDVTAVRQLFEEKPDVLNLSDRQLAELRAELSTNEDQSVVERFIEILLVIVRLPFRSIDPAKVGPILGQLIEGFWTAREFDRLIILLTHIDVASEEAPSPKARQAMAEVMSRFLSDERLLTIMKEAEQKAIALPLVSRLWDLLPDARAWPLMMEAWVRVVDQELRGALQVRMRKRLSQNPELLRSALASPDPARVRAALALLDEKSEPLFAAQLVGLASHPEESIRLKGLGAASKYGGPDALETLWKAMESDPSKSVRLFAFRTIASSQNPELAPRLRTLVNNPQFGERPVWEREKYVRLLGTVAGESAEELFESWIPAKRWMWNAKDLETLELAMRGLAACGETGYLKVQLMTESGGKPAEIARKVIDSISRADIGEQTSFMRPKPETDTLSTRSTLTNVPLPPTGRK